MGGRTIIGLAVLLGAVPASGQSSFVNWESPHVHPLAVTPDEERLVAVNTADDRLEVFRIDGPNALVHLASVPVGLDPVSVRTPGPRVAWVVNRISDSVSIVDLDALTVIDTILTADEPSDVVFAAGRAFVSMATTNELWAYDLPHAPGAAPTVIPLEGEDPRALATDGTTVWCAFFHAGNGTTVLNHSLVTAPANNPYPGAPNPPPNAGLGFEPPINPALLVDDDGDGEPDIRMPRSSMILKMDDNGDWVDDNGGNWSATALANTGAPVPWWTLHRHGAAVVDASSLAVTYVNDLLASNLAIDAHAASGAVAVVGTHAMNHVRFEPNLRGRFVTVGRATIDGGGAVTHDDLNPHIAQFFPNPLSAFGFGGLPDVLAVPVPDPTQSIGDPRGVAWAPDGTYQLVTGRGSSTLTKVAAGGQRQGHVPVGQGPTGVVIAAGLDRAYVLNQFDATVTAVDLAGLTVAGTAGFFDPTPAAIRAGRPHLYDTHKSSLLGHVSCGSCHLDGDMDVLAWDLGDPSGAMKEFNQVCLGGGTICDDEDWHPMKGPMTTQTLIGIVGTEPLHWRGDREDLAAFNGAFDSLLGGPLLSDAELAEFEAFVATLTFPPNPFRELDGSLATTHPNGGDPQAGELLFVTAPAPAGEGGAASAAAMMDGHLMVAAEGGIAGAATGGFGCAGCHALPTGTNTEILRPLVSDTPAGIHHLTKVAPLRNMYRKDGFDAFVNTPISRGTGFLHDGSLDTLQTFLAIFFAMTEQQRLDIEAFLMSFATDTHAGVGAQVTLRGADADDVARRDQLEAIASGGAVELVVKGTAGGLARGWLLVGDQFYQSDRAAETHLTADLDALVAEGAALTWTLVPAGTGIRIGLDRDEDGIFDRDELDHCSDPADPDMVPGNPLAIDPECCIAVCAIEPLCCDVGWGAACAGLATDVCVDPCPSDVNGDNKVDVIDLVEVILQWGQCIDLPCTADVNGDLKVDVSDLVQVILDWGPCPIPVDPVDG